MVVIAYVISYSVILVHMLLTYCVFNMLTIPSHCVYVNVHIIYLYLNIFTKFASGTCTQMKKEINVTKKTTKNNTIPKKVDPGGRWW